MGKFNTYPLISSLAQDDTFLVWQQSSGTVKQVATKNTGLSAVTNIAALKAISVTSLPNGTVVFVRGYYAAGDFGGGIFVYNSTSVEASNNGTIFSPNSGSGKWYRSYSGGEVNALWFGCVGDGVADDFEPLQAAITFAKSTDIGTRENGVTLYIPAGSYLCSESLDCTGVSVGPIYRSNIKIRGDGKYSTFILGTEVGYPVLDCTGCAGNTFEDFSVVAVGNGPSCCILQGRATGNGSAGQHSYKNIRTVGDATVC